MKIIITILLAFTVSASFAQTKTDSLKIPDTSKLRIIGTSTVSSSNFVFQSTYIKMYKINWAKVRTFNDFKKIMAILNMVISENYLNTKEFGKIKKYLIIYR